MTHELKHSSASEKGSVLREIDVEAHADLKGGASLARQVQLSHEQFERLYLQSGGVAAKGDLTKRFANPTPLGTASFLLCLTPFSCLLMGWHGTTTADRLPLVGAYYYITGMGMWIAGILEWVLGKTVPATVFPIYGGFFLAAGFLEQPSQGIAEAAGGANSPGYNAMLGIYYVWWTLITFIFMLAALRTNVVFVLQFLTLDIGLAVLTALYFRVADGQLEHIVEYQRAAGVFTFLTCICGWYLFTIIMLGSAGIPCPLPVGDLSDFWNSRSKES